jgi:hypothetical protein
MVTYRRDIDGLRALAAIPIVAFRAVLARRIADLDTAWRFARPQSPSDTE